MVRSYRRQPSRFEAAVAALEAIQRHRQANPTSPSDELYYRLIAEYNGRLLRARQEGRKVVGTTVYVPNEILYAMDLVPMVMENVSVTYSILCAAQEELLSMAKSFGLPPEICSNHRVLAAFFLKGYAPPVDAIVWSHILCDNTAKVGEALAQRYGIPAFFLDRPYRPLPREVDYLEGELRGMVSFLEGVAGSPLDRERLLEHLGYSHRMVALQREIDGFRRRVPSLLSNRRIYQMLFIHWLYSGSPQGVAFYQAVRDELAQAQAKGVNPPERFRLLSLFVAPNYQWKLLDWMEREHRARIVADPYHCHWGEWEFNPSQPLRSLAHKLLMTPACKQLHGPVAEFVADAVEEAREFRAMAALYWAHIGCRQACGAIRTVKDALSQAGIPTLVLDCDITDPSFAPAEELKDKLEGFFELLEERER